MIESFPKISESKDSSKEEKLSLALEISESKEIFPFSGIKSENYLRMKKDEEEFPDYTTR